MELVDLNGLISRLAKKDIIFILDHSDEMVIADLKKLSKFPNCVIYPPMAYISEEAKINRQEMFVSNIENFLKGKPTNVVN
jgi:phosphoglycerate dehydrogenase-like enzyme